jgi:hypothetical protein
MSRAFTAYVVFTTRFHGFKISWSRRGLRLSLGWVQCGLLGTDIEVAYHRLQKQVALAQQRAMAADTAMHQLGFTPTTDLMGNPSIWSRQNAPTTDTRH